jgi:hypothetical protein
MNRDGALEYSAAASPFALAPCLRPPLISPGKEENNHLNSITGYCT